MDTVQAELGPELERALLRELRQWWGFTNDRHFDGVLKPPTLVLVDTTRQLGRWERSRRTLALSRALVVQRSWGEVVEVLQHEMAHQFCDEVLKLTEEGPHGVTFRAVCAERGFDGSASGAVPRGDAGSHQRGKVVARIQKLLALADSPEVHEAEAATRAARRLLLQHNLSLAEAHVDNRYTWRQLGRPSGRVPTHTKVLLGILSQHFFVSVVWVTAYDPLRGRRGKVAELLGTPENLEIAAWVHDYLLETAERLWRSHKRERGLRSDAERRRYLQGVMVGFHEKLEQEKLVCEERGLVWRGDPGLSAFKGRRYPQLTSGRRISMQATDAWQEGRAAGREIVLRKPVQADPTRRARALPAPDRR